MARFLTPDWSAKEEPIPYAKLDDPQSLNLYSYLGNNPLAGVDADGHCYWTVDSAVCSPYGISAGSQQNGAQLPHPVTTITVKAKGPSLWSRFKSWLGGVGSGVGAAFNPWGSLGSQPHRDAVQALSDMLRKEGYGVTNEYKVDTPNGAKSFRRVDVYGRKIDENGNLSERYIQVGRTQADGVTPVSREQSAINDIEAAKSGANVEFYDYQQPYPGDVSLPGWPVQAPSVTPEVTPAEGDIVVE